ncbi:MAG: M20/M25/M40 family metallo-hydrolase [Ignavibacteriales bacterium]|nr:MAG: M20/M25/M40 family metallo-hydrolase [Ignavibacteriaceae bacterium]MBW7873008.1 M20/M25/M40 family metallo-hydrolase [Ignavibacteria bacterium]MCZ2142363.1 M20/M25/M40 family metallo-hydrolase [Ignavibacteriales bacterium]MBV6445246.1 Peptidase T [Ignavibacteriaceae bacterium]MBZ0197121.1 M20/M25/M40 family metallo-hydrolase [Ignavibacteriaceae bacterium]
MITTDRHRILEIFKNLVKIDALSCNEKPVADFVREFLKGKSVTVTEDNSGKETGSNTGNIIIKRGTGGKFMLTAHMDTARTTENITVVVDEGTGKIHTDGRTILGADNRQGMATILYLIELAENNPEIEDFTAVFFTCEETTLGGSKNLEVPAWVEAGIVFDSSHLPGKFVYRAPGSKTFTLEILGRASHSGIAPEKGINAIGIAAASIARLKQGRLDDDTTMNIGIIEGGTATNVVPEKVKIVGEVRSFKPQRLEEELERVLNTFEEEVKTAGAAITKAIYEDFTPYELSPDHLAYQLAYNAIRATNMEPQPVISFGGSDANSLNGLGIPSVNLGIGAQNPHANDEFVMWEDMVTTANIGLNIVRKK